MPMLAASLALAGACSSPDDARLRNAVAHDDDWVTHGRTYAEDRFSPLDQINEHTVGRLGVAWTFDTGSTRGIETTPLVVDGVMYVTSSWSKVFALDAETGAQLWSWNPRVSGSYEIKACCDVVNRGAAYYRGRIYVGVLDGRLAALDAGSGRVVWEVVTVDQSKPYTITGAPRIVKGQVIIGNAGAEFGVRGYVSAYDAASGELNWRVYTVPGNPADGFESEALERAAKTWSGNWWEVGGGGGTVWDSMAFDPELDLLYVGTGNGTPWRRAFRSPGGGDNLYLSSILALDPDDGRLVWHYQTTPADNWDYTATQHIILADIPIAGRVRKVLMQAPKNGFFYVLDRATGEFISAKAYTRVNWAKEIDQATGRPVESPEGDYESEPRVVLPGPRGAHSWQPMSFNPRTGLVYIPVDENPEFLMRVPHQRHPPVGFNLGAMDNVIPDHLLWKDWPTGGRLVAWDPATQTERWGVPHVGQWNGGTLTTAGNLVFQGLSNATFGAYRATDGSRLWEAPVVSAIVAPPVSYRVKDRQFVAVTTGWGGGFIRFVNSPGRVYAFTLDGTKLPPRPPRDPPAEPVRHGPDPATVARGELLFKARCGRCHSGGTMLTDLRYSQPGVFDIYPEIVLKGAYQRRGMPQFARLLKEPDVLAIRSYVLDARTRLVEAHRKGPAAAAKR